MQVLLLVWKTLLAVLGGWKELREGKAAKRAAANLSSVEDTLLVASAMKSSSINGNDSEQNQGDFHLNFREFLNLRSYFLRFREFFELRNSTLNYINNSDLLQVLFAQKDRFIPQLD